MIEIDTVMQQRVAGLETRLHRTQAAFFACLTGAAVIVTLGLGNQDAAKPQPVDELRTRRLVVVDDQNIARVIIGQDPKDSQRRSRAAGITVHDRHGVERGGFSTFDDDSVVFAMDAPKGVGDPMPDRLGLMIYPNGAAELMLLDNQTRAVAKLFSDGSGGGGLQIFKWDMDGKKINIKTIGYDGERVETIPMGER